MPSSTDFGAAGVCSMPGSNHVGTGLVSNLHGHGIHFKVPFFELDTP